MSDMVEEVVEQRQKVLSKMLIGYLLVFGSFLLQDAAPVSWLHGMQALTALPMLVGVPVLLIACWQLHGLLRRLNADRQLSQIVNDERVRDIRSKSATSALVLLLGINGLAMAAPVVAPHLITATALAECNILVGVTASLGTFLYLDRKE